MMAIVMEIDGWTCFLAVLCLICLIGVTVCGIILVRRYWNGDDWYSLNTREEKGVKQWDQIQNRRRNRLSRTGW